MWAINKPFQADGDQLVPGRLLENVETWVNKVKLITMEYISPYEGEVYTCSCGRMYSSPTLFCHGYSEAPKDEAGLTAAILRYASEGMRAGEIAEKLTVQGFNVNAPTVGRILKANRPEEYKGPKDE